MGDTSQKVKKRLITPTIKVWNHKLRFVISSALFAFFGAIIGIYIAESYYTFNLSTSSVMIVSTMFIVFVGTILLAITD